MISTRWPLLRKRQGSAYSPERTTVRSVATSRSSIAAGDPAHPDHVNYTRRGENGKPRSCFKATKYVAGKQGKLDLLEPIRPRPPTPIQGQEGFVSLVAECFDDPPFTLRPYSYREPAAGRTIGNHRGRLCSKDRRESRIGTVIVRLLHSRAVELPPHESHELEEPQRGNRAGRRQSITPVK